MIDVHRTQSSSRKCSQNRKLKDGEVTEWYVILLLLRIMLLCRYDIRTCCTHTYIKGQHCLSSLSNTIMSSVTVFSRGKLRDPWKSWTIFCFCGHDSSVQALGADSDASASTRCAFLWRGSFHSTFAQWHRLDNVEIVVKGGIRYLRTVRPKGSFWHRQRENSAGCCSYRGDKKRMMISRRKKSLSWPFFAQIFSVRLSSFGSSDW